MKNYIKTNRLNRKVKSVNLVLIYSLCACFSFAQSGSKLSKKEILLDLKYLHQSLKDAHYNLYAYTTEQKFDSIYNTLKAEITKDSLSLLESINIFQRLTSAVNNGHTEIDFPVQPYIEYAQKEGTIFPLEIAFEYNTPLIRKNWSGNKNIAIGSEILKINGKPISEILLKIHEQISAERTYFKNVKLELYSFPRYYWQVYGKQDEFDVEIRLNDTINTYTVKAIKIFEDYEMKRTELLNAKMRLAFIKQSAYLNPGNFSGDMQKFQKFIDSAFSEIQNKNSKNLIIDLRNNGGGDDAFSNYLVSYVASTPFKWHSNFSLKASRVLKDHIKQNTDTTTAFNKSILSHKNGEIFNYNFEPYQPQPEHKRFKGKVYVLVNRQSHSQSAVTAAQIQDYKFGTIVGEETGDYPTLYASQFQYALPNTKINVKVSKGYIIRVNGSTKAQGVIPDIFIKDYLVDENDEILVTLLEKIN